jgi:hypothetical protein
MELSLIPSVPIGMMTHIQTVALKILQPIVLAVIMLFSTPIAGLFHATIHATTPVIDVANETVVFKTANTSVAFKG